MPRSAATTVAEHSKDLPLPAIGRLVAGVPAEACLERYGRTSAATKTKTKPKSPPKAAKG